MSRRPQNVFRNAFVLPSLMHAWDKVRGNDGCAGGDGVTISRFSSNARNAITRLSADLLGGSYEPRDLRILRIPKQSGGTRPLAIPSVIDRIAQTAAANALTPILEPAFNRYSFGYRPGRSVVQAVRVIEGLRRRGFTHVVEADIRGCFENIPHDGVLAALEQVLEQTAGCDEMVETIGLWLEHYGETVATPGRGLAQGSPISPLLSNLYLDRLDDAFEHKGLALVRFADDFVILCRSERAAIKALERAGRFLERHGLELASEKTRVVDFDRGFAFLGHLFVRSLVLKQDRGESWEPDEILREQARLDHDEKEEEQAIEEALTRAEAGGLDVPARVLHVNEPGRRLCRQNLSFSVKSEHGHRLLTVAHARVDRIELGPETETDLDTIRHALATDTDLAFTDSRGETLGLLIRPPDEAGASLHLAQARVALDPAQATVLARALVAARLHNQRARLSILNRKARDGEVIRAITGIGREMRKLVKAHEVATLRGHEGHAAALYWPALGRLCAGAPQPFRRTRPATDALNAAINYLTALLARDIRSAMLARALHPGFGALHTSTDRAEAGVYDMMEAWRALLSEGLAVGLFNQNRLQAGMFARKGRLISISSKGRRALILGYESFVSRPVTSPWSRRKRKLRWLMREEAGQLARALRAGDVAAFQPYRQDY